MKKIILFLCILSFFSLGFSQKIDESPSIKEEILQFLKNHADAWNNGNINAYLEFYWKSDLLSFQSGNKRLYGWKKLLDRYKKSYFKDGQIPPKLTYGDLDIRIISEDYVYVLGRWKVFQNDSISEGVYTIILRRMPEGWKIIHDHSS